MLANTRPLISSHLMPTVIMPMPFQNQQPEKEGASEERPYYARKRKASDKAADASPMKGIMVVSWICSVARLAGYHGGEASWW